MTVKGEISAGYVITIIRDINNFRLTGILNIINNEGVRIIGFSRGEIIYVRSSKEEEKIGYELVRSGILSESDLALALTQTKGKRKIGIVLQQMGLVEKEALQGCLRNLFYRILKRAIYLADGEYEFVGKRKLVINDMPALLCTNRLLISLLRENKLNKDMIDKLRSKCYQRASDTEICNILKKIELNEQERKVLSIVSNCKIEEISKALDYKIERVAEIVFRLYAIGILKVISLTDDREIVLRDLYNASKGKNYYELLGCKIDSSINEIKDGYVGFCQDIVGYKKRKDSFRAQVYVEMLLEGAKEAYEVLSHKLSRQAYNEKISCGSVKKLKNDTVSILIEDVHSSILKKKKIAYHYYQDALRAEEKGLTEEKIRLLEKASLLDASNAFYLYKLGHSLYFEKGMEREGEKVLMKVAEICPYSSEVWYALYRIYERKGLPLKARQCLSKAARIDSRYGKCLTNLGEEGAKKGKIFNWKFIVLIIIYLVALISFCVLDNKNEAVNPPFLHADEGKDNE